MKAKENKRGKHMTHECMDRVSTNSTILFEQFRQTNLSTYVILTAVEQLHQAILRTERK